MNWGVIVRRHAALILLTIAVAVLYGNHHFIMKRVLAREGREYLPTIVQTDERQFTFPKAKHIFLTGHADGEVSLAEYSHMPTFMPPLPHYVLGYMARVLGSMDKAVIAADFIFPPIIFALLYVVGVLAIGNRVVAALFATVSVIIPRYLVFFGAITKYYQAWFLTQLFLPQQRLPLDRFEDPLITLTVLALLLYLVLRILRRDERVTPWLAGVAYGVLFYSYFYYAIYFSIALAALAVLLALRRDREKANAILTAILTGLIVSIPYWLNFLDLRSIPAYADIVLRIGPEHGHSPFLYPRIVFFYFQHAAFAALAWLLLRRTRPRLGIFFVALLAPVYVVYNIQIITGFNPQPDHWIKPQQLVISLTVIALGWAAIERFGSRLARGFLPITALVVTIILAVRGFTTDDPIVRSITYILAGSVTVLTLLYYTLIRFELVTKKRFVLLLAAAATGLLLVKGVEIERNYLEENLPAASLPPTELASYRWFNENAPRFSVVGTPSFTSSTYLLNLSHVKLYLPNAYDTTATKRELLDRMYEVNKMFKVPIATFSTYFATEETFPPKDYDHNGISHLFTDEYRARQRGSIFTSKGFGPQYLPRDKHRELVEGYRAILNDPKPPPYRIDYLYWGPREKVFANDPGDTDAHLKLVYDEGGVRIYEVPRK